MTRCYIAKDRRTLNRWREMIARYNRYSLVHIRTDYIVWDNTYIFRVHDQHGWIGYDPAKLPSCIIHLKCDLPRINGLEQRDEGGEMILKIWDYPPPDGERFFSSHFS